MAEKGFTKKLSTLLKRADKVVQDVQGVLECAADIKLSIDEVRQRFKKPKEDE